MLQFFIILIGIVLLLIYIKNAYNRSDGTYNFKNANVYYLIAGVFLLYIAYQRDNNDNVKEELDNNISSIDSINLESGKKDIEEVRPDSDKNDQGISYSGNLDDGVYVRFTIKMIGERTYLISNGNQSLISLLSNGRYLVEDGPMIGMTLDPSRGGCTIYAVDGTMVDILPVEN